MKNTGVIVENFLDRRMEQVAAEKSGWISGHVQYSLDRFGGFVRSLLKLETDNPVHNRRTGAGVALAGIALLSAGGLAAANMPDVVIPHPIDTSKTICIFSDKKTDYTEYQVQPNDGFGDVAVNNHVSGVDFNNCLGSFATKVLSINHIDRLMPNQDILVPEAVVKVITQHQ